MTYAECTGIAISSWPKKSFWNPSPPGLMIPATDGVSLPKDTSMNTLLTPKFNNTNKDGKLAHDANENSISISLYPH